MNPRMNFVKTVGIFALNIFQSFVLAAGIVFAVSVMMLSGNGNVVALIAAVGMLLVVRDVFTGAYAADIPLHDLVLTSVATAKTRGISVREIARAHDLARVDVQEIIENQIADGDVEACGTDAKHGVLYRVTIK